LKVQLVGQFAFAARAIEHAAQTEETSADTLPWLIRHEDHADAVGRGFVS